MKIMKVFDVADVVGTVALVADTYRVSIVSGPDADLRERIFTSYATAESWLRTMVVTLATGVQMKRGTGGRGKPYAFDQSPALGTPFAKTDAGAATRGDLWRRRQRRRAS